MVESTLNYGWQPVHQSDAASGDLCHKFYGTDTVLIRTNGDKKNMERCCCTIICKLGDWISICS